MKSHENELNSDTSETSPEIVYKLVRRVLRVDHIECENKAIRNAQRVLKKRKILGQQMKSMMQNQHCKKSSK